MSSKFIKNSRISRAPKYTQTVDNSKEMWYSFASLDNSKEQEENRLYRERQEREKVKLESIPLETLSFRDLYEFPFHQAKYGSWVYDAKGNFIFQFENGGAAMREKVVSILNGEITEYTRREVRGSEGSIEVNIEGKWKDLILIRGWGNLTG